jgi:hypothetical protein
LPGEDLEPAFLARLERAKSNLPEHGDGKIIYGKLVKSATVCLPNVCAHYAVSSLFEPYEEEDAIYCYTVSRAAYRTLQAGIARLAVGQATINSEITGESAKFSFGVLHFGDHNLAAGVRRFQSQEAYDLLVQNLSKAFATADLPAVLRFLDNHFGSATYSFRSLFRDEQRKILKIILESTLREAESAYRQVYEHHASLMRFLTDVGMPPPKALRIAAEVVLNGDLHEALEQDDIDLQRIRNLLEECRSMGVELDRVVLGHAFKQATENLISGLALERADSSQLKTVDGLVGLVKELALDVDLWKAQNVYYGLVKEMGSRGIIGGNGAEAERLEALQSLGEKLGVKGQ